MTENTEKSSQMCLYSTKLKQSWLTTLYIKGRPGPHSRPVLKPYNWKQFPHEQALGNRGEQKLPFNRPEPWNRSKIQSGCWSDSTGLVEREREKWMEGERGGEWETESKSRRARWDRRGRQRIDGKITKITIIIVTSAYTLYLWPAAKNVTVVLGITCSNKITDAS